MWADRTGSLGGGPGLEKAEGEFSLSGRHEESKDRSRYQARKEAKLTSTNYHSLMNSLIHLLHSTVFGILH